MCKGKYQTGSPVKQAIMATEQTSITETVIQIATEAAKLAVQVMAMASVENNERAQNA